MSSPSTPPPLNPVELATSQAHAAPEPPSTPPNPVAQIKLTLPTPPSFAAHRRTQSITSSPSSNAGSPQRQPKKGHNRSVSFSQDVEIKTMSPENKAPFGGLYRIPQKHEGSGSTSSIDEVSPRTRKGPPSALALGSRSSKGFWMGSGSLLSPFSRGPKTAPVQSRFATTAAARGLSIAPALAKLKDKTTPSLPGIKSIWSAGATSTGGWITPGLASAKPLTPASATTARQRGLSVAVLKDGKEMLVDSGPITPGLPSARRKSIEAPAPLAATKPEGLLSPMSRPQSANQTKEVILCRYFHTPGLTCTSRPCRFVHSLSSLPPSPSVDPAKLRMLSPTRSPDYTMGTFAQAQDIALGTTLDDVSAAQPGETVVLSGIGGQEMVGTVYLMSGGGKGPVGKTKVKYKTVACRDFLEGACPYGESCSFIHETKATTPPATDASTSNAEKDTDGQSKDPKDDDNTLTDKSAGDSSRSKSDEKPESKTQPQPKIPSRSAWSRGPPRLANSIKFKDSLSAFAAPYSTKPKMVDSKGELKDVDPEEVYIPTTTITTTVPKPKPGVKSAWTKGPPASIKIKTVTIPSLDSGSSSSENQKVEVELAFPTPSHAHLMPPISAWTMYSTDSDPAGPWDPAVQHNEYQYQHQHQQPQPQSQSQSHTNSAQEGKARPEALDYQGRGNVGPIYPWGMPMSPTPMPGHGPEQQYQLQQYPGGSGVLWTPSGWAVQDAATKRAMAYAEGAAQGTYGRKNKSGAKNYYKKRPCKFFIEGKCPHGDDCTFQHVLPTVNSEGASSSDSDSPHRPKPTQPCKFFNSQSGCQNGDSCHFLHTFVIPDGATPVSKPRPWRTRPCRHFQLAKCNLGNTCHFAHVSDPHFSLPKGYLRTANTTGQLCYEGVCSRGESCRFIHYRDPDSELDMDRQSKMEMMEMEEDHSFTEGRVEELRRLVQAAEHEAEDESDEEEDDYDVQIVTADISVSAPVAA